jgi:hypothetical protein
VLGVVAKWPGIPVGWSFGEQVGISGDEQSLCFISQGFTHFIANEHKYINLAKTQATIIQSHHHVGKESKATASGSYRRRRDCHQSLSMANM